jgi:hypothetical protein
MSPASAVDSTMDNNKTQRQPNREIENFEKPRKIEKRKQREQIRERWVKYVNSSCFRDSSNREMSSNLVSH